MTTTEFNGTQLLLQVQMNSLMTNIDDFFLITMGIIVAVICSIFYLAIGYSIAYSPGNKYIGYAWWGSVGLPVEKSAHWFFQFVFAATAATITSGAVAERCNFFAYLVYSAIISGLIYPIASHWAWSEGGWLAEMGYTDFAGAGVVHLLAGTLSFIGALSIGPRIDRFKNGPPPGHSTPLITLGALLLVVGFLAFNGGSLGHISHPGDSATVALAINNTILGGAGGALFILLVCKMGACGPRKWSFMHTINAGLAGMVSICAGADKFHPWTAIIVGIIGSIFYIIIHLSCELIKVDDPLDCTAVHFGGGLWGVLASCLLTKHGVLFEMSAESIQALWNNVAGAMIIFCWAVLTGSTMFYGLKSVDLYRVSEQEELLGIDMVSHIILTYPSEGWMNCRKSETYQGLYGPCSRRRIDCKSHNEITYPPEAWKIPHSLPQGFDNDHSVIGKPGFVASMNILHKKTSFSPPQVHDNRAFEMRGGRD